MLHIPSFSFPLHTESSLRPIPMESGQHGSDRMNRYQMAQLSVCDNNILIFMIIINKKKIEENKK